jgi:hypothetical protein
MVLHLEQSLLHIRRHENTCKAKRSFPEPVALFPVQYAAFEDSEKVYLLQEFAEGVSGLL